MGKSKSIYVYDRASGKCVVEDAPSKLACTLTGTRSGGLRSRLGRPASCQEGFFAVTRSHVSELSDDEVFRRSSKLYLVECNEGPLTGKKVLFESLVTVAEYFGWKRDSISTRVHNKKNLPGDSKWVSISKPDPRLAEVSRWDPVNGLWDLECDLADLELRKPLMPVGGRSARNVYLYDRASGKHLATLPSVGDLSELTGEETWKLRQRISNSVSHRRGLVVASFEPPETCDVMEPFSDQTVLYLIDRYDEEGSLLVRGLNDVATWVGCSPSTVIDRMREGMPLPGRHDWRRVTEANLSFADVPRWDSEHGYWTLNDVLAYLNER